MSRPPSASPLVEVPIDQTAAGRARAKAALVEAIAAALVEDWRAQLAPGTTPPSLSQQIDSARMVESRSGADRG